MGEGLHFDEAMEDESEPANKGGKERRDEGGRLLSIVEALLLSIVTVTVAWSGFAAAKWDTRAQNLMSSSTLASIDATQATNNAQLIRTADIAAFDAWFTAYVAGSPEKMELAKSRFRPDFRTVFDAWWSSDPVNGKSGVPHPMSMAGYAIEEDELAEKYTLNAQELSQQGVAAGQTADNYVRTTVVLAAVLFLVGISRTFTVAALRTTLLTVGGTLLLIALILNFQQPSIPA